MDNPMSDALNSQYWNQRIEQADMPWDIGSVSTPIKNYIDQLTNKDLAILIPGCGNSYEAGYLLATGFTNITVIDIAPAQTKQLQEKYAAYINKALTVITGNFFDLTEQFDLILEQTFFCALDPKLRNDYVQQMHRLLKPGGKLAGVFFNRNFEGGPPFSGSIAEYEVRFAPYFTIHTLAPCTNSIEKRAGTEAFAIFSKKEK
jgi:methyl halide transferase